MIELMSSQWLHGPMGPTKAPSPVVASTLAPAEISFSATAARPSLVAQCSAETPYRAKPWRFGKSMGDGYHQSW